MKIRPEAGSFGFIIILAAVSALGPFSIDMYLPALPDMSRALGASPAVMQMTITAFLAGIAIGPLFLAPLSDAWGRKKTQLVFLLLFSLASAACMLAESGEALVALRAVQAIVAGAAMTSARAMLSDIFEGDALSRATSILMAFFTMAPVIAPMVGASLLEIFDWRGIFGALVALGVVSALLMQILPETLPPERRSPYAPRAVIAGYVAIMKDTPARRYLASTFCFAFMFFGMLAASPFIFIEHYGMSPGGFSVIFASISAASLIGNFVNARLVFRLGYDGMLKLASRVLLVLAIAMAIVAATGIGGIWGVFAVMVWLMGVFQVSIANTMAGLMKSAKGRPASASAALAFWRFLGGALGSMAVGAFNTSHPWPFALVMGLAALGAIAALRIWPAAAPDVR